MRRGYGKEVISLLANINSLSDENARKLYNRLYGQARRLYKETDRPFRITRELYYSLVGTNNLNAYKFSNDGYSIDKSWKLDDRKILSTSLSALIETTRKNGKSPIEDLIDKYEKNEITYSEFKDKIDDFKNSIEYKAIQKETYYMVRNKRRKHSASEDFGLVMRRPKGGKK